MGKTVSIYLEDDDYKGIKTIGVRNWSGQAVSAPIGSLKKLKDRDALKTPGVYFIFGINGETGEEVVYIGEAESPIDRLLSHEKLKDDIDWQEAVIFTDTNDLNKAHIKFLESNLVKLAQEAKRYNIHNRNIPQCPQMNKPGDSDAMFEFIDFIRIIFSAISHRVLEPIYQRQISKDKVDDIEEKDNGLSVTLSIKDIKASGIYNDGGILILEGSSASISDTQSMSLFHKNTKEELIKKGILVIPVDKNEYVFSEDYFFKSVHKASTIIAGRKAGFWSWKMKDGVRLRDYLNSLNSQPIQIKEKE